MCGPVAGILSAIAPFVPIISKFIGGGQRQQQQAQAPRQQRGATPADRLQRERGQRVENEETRSEETETAMSNAARLKKKREQGGTNTQAGKADQTAADTGTPAENVETTQDQSGITT